jgi:hypothetical protein
LDEVHEDNGCLLIFPYPTINIDDTMKKRQKLQDSDVVVDLAKQFRATHLRQAQRYKGKPKVNEDDDDDDDNNNDEEEVVMAMSAGSIVVLSSLVWHRRLFI